MDWDGVIEELGPKLYRYFRVSFPEAESSDCVQEVLLRLYRLVKEKRFDPNRAALPTVAYGIAHNVQLEHGRFQTKSRSRNQELVENVLVCERPTAEQNMLYDEERRQLRAGIDALSNPEKNIIALLIDESLDLASIGQILNLPLGTVKSHISRAKEKLRKFVTAGKKYD